MDKIINQFDIENLNWECIPFGDGLINSTYALSFNGKPYYILQKINKEVFPSPQNIFKNNSIVANYLKENYPDYLFISSINTKTGASFLIKNQDYWRLTKFIENSYSINKVEQEDQAYELGKAFGGFAHNVSELSAELLTDTIVDFHNLTLRVNQYKEAIANAIPERLAKSEKLIKELKKFEWVDNDFKEICNNKKIPTRVIHHDAKINNILLDKNTKKAVAVCDLDTLMQGYIFSDFGDLIRTSICSESEESVDFEKVKINMVFFEKLTKGFFEKTRSILSDAEKDKILFSGYFILYMQTLRFISDYLTGDTYYKTTYNDHNFNRAKNQLTLLQNYDSNKVEIEKIIAKHIK